MNSDKIEEKIEMKKRLKKLSSGDDKYLDIKTQKVSSGVENGVEWEVQKETCKIENTRNGKMREEIDFLVIVDGGLSNNSSSQSEAERQAKSEAKTLGKIREDKSKKK